MDLRDVFKVKGLGFSVKGSQFRFRVEATGYEVKGLQHIAYK